MSNETPEGYEPAENSAAKDVAMDALEAAFTDQMVDPHDGENPIDLINLADAVIEALLKAGVTIPESIEGPGY